MTTQRFDHVWHRMISDHASLVRHYNGARTAMRLFRKAAYRFAKGWLDLQANYHNEFLEFAKTSCFDVTEWMDEHFAPIEEAGDNRQVLLGSIQDGMTETEYVKQGHLWGVKKRASSKSVLARADLEKSVDETDLVHAELVAMLRKKFDAAVSEIRQLRRDIAALIQENEQLQRGYDRINRVVQKQKKKAG